VTPSLVRYAGAPIAICEAARALPNPPTGAGADVSGWTSAAGLAVEEFELTILAGATVEVAAGAMLVAEEVHPHYLEDSNAVTATNGTETINYTAHGFYTGDGPIRFGGTAVPTGLSATAEYWVIRTGANTFQVATSRANALAGTEQLFTSDGTDVVVHWVDGVKSTSSNASAVDLDEDTLTIADHGLVAGERVQVATTNTLPTGLAVDTDYFVIVVDDDTIQLASSAENALAGTEIDLTGAPAGTQSVISNGYAATSETVYVMFAELNGGAAFDLTASIGYRERIAHRPGVVAYHLVTETDEFVPLTSYVRPISTLA
jgi:hypothetical protein